MNIQQFWIFALASFLLNITPGNDMLYVASRSAGQGTHAGIISSLGIFAGCLVHLMAAMLGLSAIIAESATLFNMIKYAGAAYLVYLGIKTLLSKSSDGLGNLQGVQSIKYRKIFWQGALTNMLNPKVALFFLAFLPQFISPKSAHAWLQILFLGTWFNIGGTVVNIIVSMIFGRIGHSLKQSPGWILIQQKITGLVLILLGLKVALTSKK